MFDAKNIKFEVKNVSSMPIAYIGHVGPYAGDENLFSGLYGKIFNWAGPRGLLRFPETKAVCVYYNDPSTTAPEDLRISVGITVPADTKVDGEIKKMDIEGGKYAIGHFEITSQEFADVWGNICRVITEAGYEFEEKPCFELYHNNADEHPEHKHIVDIYLPVK